MEDQTKELKEFMTSFDSVDLNDGIVKRFEGERIFASNFECAEIYCRLCRPFLRIEGQIVQEIMIMDEINN